MSIYSDLLADAKTGKEGYLLTLTTAPPGSEQYLGQQMLLYPDGQTRGCIIDVAFTADITAAMEGVDWTQPSLLKLDQNPGCAVFWDKISLQQRVVVFGGGHISQPLVEFLSLVGYTVTVVDDRPDFANQSRFPKAEHIICCSFKQALTSVRVDHHTAIVIVTRGHLHDLECLRCVLPGPAFYIGMIGSRHKIRTIFEALAEEGASPESIQRVRAPIGLDIHAQSPAEIALSIAAEIVAAEKGGTCLPLSQLQRRSGQ